MPYGSQKKTVEEFILRRFVSNKDLGLIVSSLEPLDPPDFRMKRYINGGFKNIGVALTSVINPNLKQIESAQEKVVQMAREGFNSVSPDKLVVYVYFSRNTFSFDRASLKSLASYLQDFVTKVALANKGLVSTSQQKTSNCHLSSIKYP